ncbi:MAG: MarR family transcriptional regulator [Actinobacteria bacterium]|nr:MarR family transcriptional regulator [Actinomycetota bacterium]
MKETQPDTLAEELIETVIMVFHRFRDERRWRGAEDLSFPQIMLLLQLHREGPMSTGEVARNLCVTQGVITRMVDLLKQKGLIERVRKAEDRRVVILSLTPQGKRKAARIRKVMVEEAKDILRAVPSREREELHALLRRMRDRFENPVQAP